MVIKSYINCDPCVHKKNMSEALYLSQVEGQSILTRNGSDRWRYVANDCKLVAKALTSHQYCSYIHDRDQRDAINTNNK